MCYDVTNEILACKERYIMKKIWVMLLSLVMIAWVFAGVVTASAAPVEPVLILEGEQLLPDRNRHEDYKYISNCSGELDGETGIVRLTALGSDPYYWLLPKNTKVAPVMVIKYRTESIGIKGKIYASTTGISERGAFEIPYISDGTWRLLVVDLPLWLSAESYDMDTDVLDHLRFDFINVSGDQTGQWIEVEYVAFFYNERDVEAYDDFRVNGEPEEGSTALEPETLDTAPADDVESTVEETTGELVQETVQETIQETVPTATEGCRASLGVAGALTLATALAAGVTFRKKIRSRTEIK